MQTVFSLLCFPSNIVAVHATSFCKLNSLKGNQDVLKFAPKLSFFYVQSDLNKRKKMTISRSIGIKKRKFKDLEAFVIDVMMS